MSRLAMILAAGGLATLGLATLGLAAGATVAQAQSAAVTDPETKLAFLPTLGGATFERSANGPSHGTTYIYSTPKKLMITVQIFDRGRPVSAGSTNPIVMSEFSDELQLIEQQVNDRGYSHFQRPSVPSSCSYGTTTFRCITYGALSPNNVRIYSKLLLTGYREHFVAINVEWGQAMQHSGAYAEAALQAFIPALMH
jgi:hypothetical protein